MLNTISLIKSLIRNSTDSDAKDHYELCLTHFTEYDALKEVEKAEEMLKAKDYKSVNQAAGDVGWDAETCVYGDSPSDPVFPDHSLLPHFAAYVELVTDIICVIASYLSATDRLLIDVIHITLQYFRCKRSRFESPLKYYLSDDNN
ncbi:hypothetical protein PIB30_055096 [Stylosanthes scabra]|uniref:Pectinesterase inhibitor domain-containing protein n=1 Tax=Stylosanthes scabra TaxID=79078 RepID=A0ABU6SJ63_9FABA|nr:hypothetical protein [Stylosanthes scabra]